MWAYIKTAFSFITGLFSTSKGDSSVNILGYVAVALGTIIVVLITMIYTKNGTINELQSQVNNSNVALEYQNAMIESNRVKNEALNKELRTYIDKVKADFANIKTPEANHKEAQNSCEVFISDLAEAWQK